MSELKPCPSCGEIPYISKWNEYYADMITRQGFRPDCSCGLKWPTETSMEAAISLCNRRAPQGAGLTCQWKEDQDGNWNTDCGGCFCLEDDGPVENKMKFCPYCGKGLVEVKYVEPSDEEEGAPPPAPGRGEVTP